jgi:hypothetical protein
MEFFSKAVDVVKTPKPSIDSKDEKLWNKMNRMVTRSLQQQLDLEANHQVTRKQTKDNLENGKEYVGLIETSYRNLMLDK